jgi:hypothetical protein
LLSKNASQRRLISAVSIVVFLTVCAGLRRASQCQGYAGRCLRGRARPEGWEMGTIP